MDGVNFSFPVLLIAALFIFCKGSYGHKIFINGFKPGSVLRVKMRGSDQAFSFLLSLFFKYVGGVPVEAVYVSGSQRMKAVLGQSLNRHGYVFLLISFSEEWKIEVPFLKQYFIPVRLYDSAETMSFAECNSNSPRYTRSGPGSHLN